MRQTIATLSADVQPRSLAALRDCIAQLKAAVEGMPGRGNGYTAFGARIPRLHFVSIMVFEDAHYDPLLTIELNIDGDLASFLPQLEIAGLQPFLRTMVRCCKEPIDPAAARLHRAVVAAGSQAPLASFLLACLERPAVFHQGNRGLERDRIQQEADLFAAVQKALAAPALYRATDPVTLHQHLRAAVGPAHPWLDAPAAPRWTRGERLADWARLVAFGVALVFCLALPGMILALLIGRWPAVLLCLVAAFGVALATPGLGERLVPWRSGAAPPPPAARLERPCLPYVPGPSPEVWLGRGLVAIAGALACLLLVAAIFALVLAPFHPHAAFGMLYAASFWTAFAGLFTIPLPLALVLFALRRLEQRDPTQDMPIDDPTKLAALLASEDQIAQNHMGSLVLIKPGVLRAIVVRAGLLALGLFLRVTRTDGYLSSMRTIHFAHWAILGNGGRLVFFSNFDSSWESYLDDFIEKASVGLTLAWTNGVGFAPTEFLVFKGATKGALFKAWARHSMAETLFWFSAYPTLSVNQVERQFRIAEGLRRPHLSKDEAARWACDL